MEHCVHWKCLEDKHASVTIIVFLGLIVSIAAMAIVAVIIPSDYEYVQMGYSPLRRGRWIMTSMLIPIAFFALVSFVRSTLWCRQCPNPKEESSEGRFGFPYIV